MHLADPIAQAVEDQPPDDRFVGVQCVAAAGVIGVARLVVRKNVVGLVGQAAKADRGAAVVAFGGVIVDDVEDDLDPGAVQRLDHIAKFVDAPSGSGREL